MQPPVLRLLPVLWPGAIFVEDGKEERAVVERTVLDRVVEFRHARRIELFLLDVAEIFKQLLPAFAEEPRLVAAAPAFLDLVDVHPRPVAVHDLPEGRQQLYDLLRTGRVDVRRSARPQAQTHAP